LKTSEKESKKETLKKKVKQMKIKTKSQMEHGEPRIGSNPKAVLRTVPSELRSALEDVNTKPKSKENVGCGQTPLRPSRMCTVPKELRAALVEK